MTLLFVSFIAGILTVLAPCILPLLPVIVGRSLTDQTLSKRRLFIVVTSLGLSIIAFTLLLKASTLLIDIPQNFWKYFSGGIIFIFGLVSLFPNLWEKFSFANTISQKSNAVMTEGYKKDNVWGDIIVGASLGPIFSACSPTYFVILATVLPVSIPLGILYLAVFSLGLALALIFVALIGQKIVNKLGIVSDSRGWFKRTMGIIFIIVAIGIISGYDKKLQISLLDAGFFDVTKVEQKLLDKQEDTQIPIGTPTADPTLSEADKTNDISKDDQPVTPDSVPVKEKDSSLKSTGPTSIPKFLSVAEKSKIFPLAPDISTPDGFINTNNLPINISQYKGKKVVLLDIWTYSCINCQRTLPYLNAWHKKYEDEGLVIIGLHTPEFSFERVQKNVEQAVKDFDIKYPVVLDNDFSTWNAYKNQYWPRKYLIDIDGYIVYDHAGEGAYEVTEKKIQDALNERNVRLETGMKIENTTVNPTDKIVVTGSVGSPEVYFGSSRNEFLENGKAYIGGTQTLTVPTDIKSNKLYLGGTWNLSSEYATNMGEGNVVFKYKAKNVYFVASSVVGADVEVYIDGKFSKTVSVKNETLYQMISGDSYGEHTMELKIKKGTLNIFTFTFG